MTYRIKLCEVCGIPLSNEYMHLGKCSKCIDEYDEFATEITSTIYGAYKMKHNNVAKTTTNVADMTTHDSEVGFSKEASYISKSRQQAKEYLGERYVLHPQSTFTKKDY